MPYQVNNNDGGLMQLLGLAQGVASYISDQKKNKADASQRAIENAQNAQRIAIEKSNSDASLRGQGIDPATGKPVNFAPPKELTQILPKNGGHGSPSSDDYVQHYLALSAAAMQSNPPRPDLAAHYKGLADSYGLDTQRTANATYTSGARTNLTNAQTENVKGLFAQQRALLNARGQQMMDRALATARSRVGRGANPNTAYLNALNAMSRTEYGAQIRGALDQYNQAEQDYRSDPTNNPQPQTLNLNVPAPTIYVLGPNGQPMAVQAPQPQGQHPQAKAQAKPPQAPQPTQSGGKVWYEPWTWGNSDGAPPSGGHHLRATSHGKPIHSDDGGKTWQPGP